MYVFIISRMGADRYPDPRDRVAPRPYAMEDRARADPYFRERDPLGARPPPEYYDRLVSVIKICDMALDKFFKVK